jgi:peptidyl-prolyl cis-trans isomerase C
VGGHTLTAGEADKQITAMLGPQAAQLGPERIASLMGRFRQQAIERFVIRTLLSGEVEKRQIAVADGDIAEAMDTIKARLPEGMSLDDALKKENMTVEGLRSNLVSELRIKKLVESEVPTNSVPTDAEVAEFYEKQKDQFKTPESVEARHILIKVESSDDEKAKTEKKAKAEGLRKQLVDGADFAKLAKENSDCPSKDRGGDLGSFQRGQMVKAFEDAAFSQETNAVGPVVETMFGYHVIQVQAHKAAGASSLADVKERLAEHLKQRKQMELFDAFLAKIKANVKIAYAEGFAPAAKPAMAE